MRIHPQWFFASDRAGGSASSQNSGTGSCTCGPDLTAYMTEFINAACDSQGADLLQQYITSGNQDQYDAALMNLGGLFGVGESWNFSGYIVNFRTNPPSLWAQTSDCPSGDCPDCNLGITLCGYCFDYTTPGKIIYGYVGSYLGLSSDVLQAIWAIVLTGELITDTAPDAAVSAGIALHRAAPSPPVDLSAVCPAISPYFQSMDVLPDCIACTTPWSGALPPS
jgi:hypothetical protein